MSDLGGSADPKLYGESDDDGPYGVTSWEKRLANTGEDPDWQKKQQEMRARLRATLGPATLDGADGHITLSNEPCFESSPRDNARTGRLPMSDEAGNHQDCNGDATGAQAANMSLNLLARKAFKFGYGLAVRQGKVPPPKSMSSALISSYASESATHSQDQQGQHSQDSKTDKPQNLGSANAEVVAEQPSDATALKSKHAAASKLSIAAASGGWKRPLAWEKLTADGSNSAAANARSSSQSNSAQQALNLPAHAKTSSHEQLHGSGPIHRRSRHSRRTAAMIAAWRQERDRQMAQQRKKEEEKLRKEKEARRAKAACEAKRRLAAEQKLAALAALPAAEHRRRNAQLKASRDFSDSPDETAPIAPARSCHPKLIAPVQPKAAFKPAGSYSSLTKTASQRAVSTQRQKAVGAAGSDRQAAHKRAKAQAAKRNAEKQLAEDRARREEMKTRRQNQAAAAAARDAEKQLAEGHVRWEQKEMETRRKNEAAATAARLQREAVRQEAALRRQQEERAKAAAIAEALARAAEEEAEKAKAAAQVQMEEDAVMQEDEVPNALPVADCTMTSGQAEEASCPAEAAAGMGTSSTEDDRSHVTAQDCNTQDNNDSNQLRMTSHASTSPSNADSHDKPQDIPYNGTQQYYSIVGSKASPHSGPSSAQQTAVLKPQLSEGISRGGPSTAGPNSRAFLPEVGQLYAQWQSEDFQDARLDQVGTGGNPQPASQGPSGLVLSSRLSHTSQVTDPKTRASGVSKLGKRSRHEEEEGDNQQAPHNPNAAHAKAPQPKCIKLIFRDNAGVPHRLERNATGGVAISATQPTYLSSMPPPGPRLRPWK